MSGVEIGGLVIGLLPILSQAVSGYRRTRETFHSFASFATGIRRLQCRFKIQETVFRNECRHFLSLAVEDADLSAMLLDPNCPVWSDDELDHRLRMKLGDTYSALNTALEVISDMLREVQQVVDGFVQKLPDGGSQKFSSDLLAHFRQKMKFSIDDEKKCKAKLDELHTWVTDLSLLRSQIRDFQHESPSMACMVRKKIPDSFSIVHQASESLHTAFAGAWSCSDSSHANHQAKLWLESEVQPDLKLDVAILFESWQNTRQRYVQFAMQQRLQLYIKFNSVIAPCSPNGLQDLGAKDLAYSTCSAGTSGNPSLQITSKKVFHSSPTKKEQRNSKKRVKFNIDSEDEHIPNPSEQQNRHSHPASEDMACHSTLDLRCLYEDMCTHMARTTAQGIQSEKDLCLGYLENVNQSKLVFFGGRSPTTNTSFNPSENIIPLETTIGSLQPCHRLRLAIKIAKAVLKFHETPWLPEDWRLENFGYFGRPDHTLTDLEHDLKSLHLTLQIPVTAHTSSRNAPQGNLEAQSLPEADARHQYGIRNLTLANLGIAMLEIGLSKGLRRYRRDDETHNIVTARKLAATIHTPLGPCYQKIIRKLLHCDFAFGADLATKELQDAVYSDVVCSLEDLLQSFENFGLN